MYFIMQPTKYWQCKLEASTVIVKSAFAHNSFTNILLIWTVYLLHQVCTNLSHVAAQLVLVLPVSHSQLATQFSRTGIVKIFESRSLHCFLLYLPFSSNAQFPDLVIVVIKDIMLTGPKL
jgi:hypothetical protein